MWLMYSVRIVVAELIDDGGYLLILAIGACLSNGLLKPERALLSYMRQPENTERIRTQELLAFFCHRPYR